MSAIVISILILLLYHAEKWCKNIVVTKGFFIFLQFFPNQFDDFEY